MSVLADGLGIEPCSTLLAIKGLQLSTNSNTLDVSMRIS